MLLKLTAIIIYALWAFVLALLAYPWYISVLRKLKIWKNIRETDINGERAEKFIELHKHKKHTPNLWWWMFLIVMAIMIVLSLGLQYYGFINNSLLSRQETYIVLFAFFFLWFLGLLDDYLNIKWVWSIKWLSAKAKIAGMVVISAFISRWFYDRLGIDYVNFWPIAGKIDIGLWYPIITFFVTISIVNAINITDGLDGLAGGLMAPILLIFAVITFTYQTYIATTIIAILIAVLVAFLRYNINPAQIFMWDSWSFALWWFLATMLYVLNMRMGIFIPFLIMFAIFILDVWSSSLQILSKKFFGKKLFPIAPFHHTLEWLWYSETNIVMRAWLVQAILCAITIIVILYQILAI